MREVSLKIAALTPVALGAEVLCADQCRKMFDEHITLPDLWTPWDDYRNRLALLALARGFEFVAWIDADEKFGPEVSRKALESEFSIMLTETYIATEFKVKEMWNAKQWRYDGIWDRKSRVVLQRNPFYKVGTIELTNSDAVFHRWPLQNGQVMRSPLSILHFGMSTPEKRYARMEKWKRLDPLNTHQAIGYDYLCDPTGIQLKEV